MLRAYEAVLVHDAGITVLPRKMLSSIRYVLAPRM
jgi:hypothetical protein